MGEVTTLRAEDLYGRFPSTRSVKPNDDEQRRILEALGIQPPAYAAPGGVTPGYPPANAGAIVDVNGPFSARSLFQYSMDRAANPLIGAEPPPIDWESAGKRPFVPEPSPQYQQPPQGFTGPPRPAPKVEIAPPPPEDPWQRFSLPAPDYNALRAIQPHYGGVGVPQLPPAPVVRSPQLQQYQNDPRIFDEVNRRLEAAKPTAQKPKDRMDRIFEVLAGFAAGYAQGGWEGGGAGAVGAVVGLANEKRQNQKDYEKAMQDYELRRAQQAQSQAIFQQGRADLNTGVANQQSTLDVGALNQTDVNRYNRGVKSAEFQMDAATKNATLRMEAERQRMAMELQIWKSQQPSVKVTDKGVTMTSYNKDKGTFEVAILQKPDSAELLNIFRIMKIKADLMDKGITDPKSKYVAFPGITGAHLDREDRVVAFTARKAMVNNTEEWKNAELTAEIKTVLQLLGGNDTNLRELVDASGNPTDTFWAKREALLQDPTRSKEWEGAYTVNLLRSWKETLLHNPGLLESLVNEPQNQMDFGLGDRSGSTGTWE